MYKDVPCGGIVVDPVEQVLQVVELAMDVSDEDDSGGAVCGRDVERDGLDVLTEIRLLQEVRQEGPGSDASEEEIEEENCEDGEGGHGTDSKVGCEQPWTSHGWYK